MIQLISKMIIICAFASFYLVKSQSVKEILNLKSSFRKDTVFIIKKDSKETYVPLTIIKGKQKGPVFSIVAGIHGYEYPPIVAVQELLNEIKPENIKGTLIIIPIANIESFHKRTPFVNPLDGKNLNNAFPGSSNGSPTDQIAHLITEEIISNSDIFLDIHGGDASEDLIPFVCFYDRKDTKSQTDFALNLSKASGIENIVSYPYNLKPSDPSKYAFKEATQRGIAALSIEAGKLGAVQQENVDLIKDSVLKMLSFSGNLNDKSGKKNSLEKQKFYNQQDYIRVPENGIFYSMLKSGDEVKKNQILGYITDEFGNRKKDVISGTDGVTLYKVGTPPVNKGETLFCIGYFK